jgi:hypothetical protein|tara:strand:- start:1425 stop:1799 length:375 start_codon:yes stop_codon:yes gene_type:complete
MPIAAKANLTYPGPTAGVTLLGSNNNLTNYTDVTPAVPSDHQVAILSIISNYIDGSIDGEVPIVVADEDGNVLFCVSAGGDSSNEYGFLYPPLLPAGKKLKVKTTTGTNEANLVIYVQYMLVPV